MLITILEAILLGIIQGATEFIPISSSAHLIIVPWLFGWSNPALSSLPFDVALHMGTLLAVLVYFANDWICLIRAWFASIIERRVGKDPDRRLAWFVVLGTLPGVLVGFLAQSKIEELFHTPNMPIQTGAMIALAVLMAGMGAVLWLADRYARHTVEMEGMTLKQALIIGTAQAAAIFPGVSRAGSTISAGLALGFKRETAAKFSFLLSAPIIAGGGLKSIYDIYKGMNSGAISSGDLILFPIGMAVAAITGYLCIHFLLTYLQKHTVKLFAFYRFALAALVLIFALAR